MANIDLKELLEAGCHFGHQARRWNPAMAKYIYTERDGVHIFDLVQTKQGLEDAAAFAKAIAAEGGLILFVGTKRQAQDVVKQEAVRVGMPYMTSRWVGGLLTNWTQMEKRLRRLVDLKSQRDRGDLKKYTKREQLLFDREIDKLERFFGGVSALTGKPAAIFVVDSHREEVAVKEAIRMEVPVIALVDTNGDPAGIAHVVPTNDDAVKSIELMVKYIADAIEEGKKGVKKNDS